MALPSVVEEGPSVIEEVPIPMVRVSDAISLLVMNSLKSFVVISALHVYLPSSLPAITLWRVVSLIYSVSDRPRFSTSLMGASGGITPPVIFVDTLIAKFTVSKKTRQISIGLEPGETGFSTSTLMSTVGAGTETWRENSVTINTSLLMI